MLSMFMSIKLIRETVKFCCMLHTQKVIHYVCKYVPSYLPLKYDDFVKEHSAVLRLTGSEDPDSLSDLPPHKVNDVLLSHRHSLRKYFEEGVSKSQIHWLVAAAATPKWAKKIYPELDEKKAYDALWEDIFKVCRADKPNCLELWQEHNTILQKRAKKLTDLKIKEFHFTGPDTDLKVFLYPKPFLKAVAT